MPIYRALRLLNAVESGATDATALQALLADPGRASEWSALLTMPGQVRRLFGSEISVSAVFGAPRALAPLLASASATDQLYMPDSLRVVAPSAWAVYDPRRSQFTLSGSSGGEIAGWRNALGVEATDAVQTTSANRPAAKFDKWIFAEFSGAQTLALESLFSGEYSLFVVSKTYATVAMGLIGWASNAGFGYASGGSVQQYGAGSTGSLGAPQTANQWALSRFRMSGGYMYFSRNGAAEGVGVSTGAVAAINVIGRAMQPGGNLYFSGAIAEIWLVKNGSLASAEVQRVTTLLKAKYGV